MLAILSHYHVNATRVVSADVPALLQSMGPSVVVVVLYATQVMHNTGVKTTGVALVLEHDAAAGVVVLADAEPTTWGEHVTAAVATLVEATAAGREGCGVLCLRGLS